MIRVTALFLALLLLLAAAGCTVIEDTSVAHTAASSSNEEPGPTSNNNDDLNPADTNDDTQIYAAGIRQIYTVDYSFGEPPGWSLVYVVTTTDDIAIVNAPTYPSQKHPADLQEAITAELADEPFELIWIEAFDDAPNNPTSGQIAAGDGIIITLGNIHPQDDGSVQVPFFMTCGGLCGIGKTYVLNQFGDVWRITGSVDLEIMS